MGLQLETIIPWGRSLDEYSRMFHLTSDDLHCKILDCAGGPASFNTEMTRQGHAVISCDPIYQFSVNEIERRIQDTYPVILEGVRENVDSYVWDSIHSPEQLGEIRLSAMRQFLDDFPTGRQQGRYQCAELPRLPFGDRQFDLALCGHFLFSYSKQLSIAFHLDAIRELCRVADEVRIFPIVALSGDLAPALSVVIETLAQEDCQLDILTVPYEFQKNGNQLLKITQRP
ncbi:MAG: SAM-dependent methyltransferase [Elainellaceae cyanobacterium]